MQPDRYEPPPEGVVRGGARGAGGLAEVGDRVMISGGRSRTRAKYCGRTGMVAVVNDTRNKVLLNNGVTANVNASKCNMVERVAVSVERKPLASVARVDGGGVGLVQGGVAQVLTMIQSVIAEGRMMAKRSAIEELGCRITEAMPSTRARQVGGKPAKRVKVAEVVVENEPTEGDASEEESVASAQAEGEADKVEPKKEKVGKGKGEGK